MRITLRVCVVVGLHSGIWWLIPVCTPWVRPASLRVPAGAAPARDYMPLALLRLHG